MTFGRAKIEECPVFVEPPEGGAEEAERRKEKRAILEFIAAQEAQMQKLLEELEAERARAEQAVASAAEREAARTAGQQAAAAIDAVDPLSFNEQETRRYLIDLMLADAGWNVGPGLTSTQDVKKEVEVLGQPTDSGKGFADYVLIDGNGKPLAVIEAKKTSKNSEIGRTQAKLYADGLETEHGQRPVIFYTNGYDLWIWNDAAGESPRKIYGFHSKDSIQYLRFQLTAREPRAKVAPAPGIIDRLYQHEAVKKVVERFAEKKRKALVVQATGTGKTRVAVALCDALIRAKWARRILFLCDRRELRKQANNVFKESLPGEPRAFITSGTAHEREKRIYLATYPAMMKCFHTFDIGFFDLIIADESHRSIYNRYRDILEYFDAHLIGLTATPVRYVLRDTFRMFGCEAGDPTFNYDYRQAVEQGYLVPFEVETHTHSVSPGRD
jgi:type I restriction enzyme R subunit